MPQVRKSDYDKIVKVYNESGNKAAMEYIEGNFGTKYPRDVIRRIKKSSNYKYDYKNSKLINKKYPKKKSIFIGIDELCNQTVSTKSKPITTTNLQNTTVQTTKENALELLCQELLQEKIMELTKYVQLNRYLNTISINKSALISDGYQVAIY